MHDGNKMQEGCPNTYSHSGVTMQRLCICKIKSISFRSSFDLIIKPACRAYLEPTISCNKQQDHKKVTTGRLPRTDIIENHPTVSQLSFISHCIEFFINLEKNIFSFFCSSLSVKPEKR